MLRRPPVHPVTNPAAGGPTTPWPVPVVLAIVCTGLAGLSAVDPRWHGWLDYERAAVATGEVWRLATAHLVHLSTAHAALDIAALLLVAWIFGAALPTRRLLALVAVAMAVIDASLWWLHPEVDRYAGLSGLLHAWFAAGATIWLFCPSRTNASDASHASVSASRAWGAALLAGLAAKLALESGHHAFWLADAGFVVVTAAHRWGAVAGVVCATTAVVIAAARRPSATVASRPR